MTEQVTWTWCLPEIARTRQVHGPSALSAALAKVGYCLSVAQASRLLRSMPARLDTGLLIALTAALETRLTDLIDDGQKRTKPESRTSAPPAPSPPAASPTEPERERLRGPRAVPLAAVNSQGLRRVV